MSGPSRSEWIAAIREVLDILDADPGIPMVDISTSLDHLQWWLAIDGTAPMMARIEAALPCEMTGGIHPKNPEYYRLAGTLHGVPVRVVARADLVAERKVTGMAEVVEWVRRPAGPQATAAEGEE